MRRHDSRSVKLSRREAMSLLGAGAGLGLVTALRGSMDVLGASQTGVPQATKLAFSKGAVIRTLLKDVSPDSIGPGATLFHEHLTLGGSKDVAWMVDEVRAAGKNGVSCLVDAGPNRRSDALMEDLRQIAAGSDVRIVLGGGYYQDISNKIMYPPEVAQLTEDQLVEELVRDAKSLRWGAYGEVASSPEMQPDERKVHRATGRAHLRTGLPIFTHTAHSGCPTCALEQLEIYESLGVDPRHLCIGHLSDFKDDPRAVVPKLIAKRGAFLGFDTLRPETPLRPTSMERAAEMVLAVIAAGYEDHVLMSHDALVDQKWFAHNGGAGYAMLLTFFVPKLRAAGVKEATLHKILVDNPRRFLAFVPPRSS